MKFSAVSEKFTEMSKTTKRLELSSLLTALFRSANKDLKKLVYLTQGQLGPDYHGIEMGMSSKLMIKALSQYSGIAEEKIEENYAKKGDIGLVAEELARGKRQNALYTEELTVDYVYDSLMRMSKISGSGSVKNKISIYLDLISSGTPEDALYITRIINGKLRLGVSDATILDGLVNAFAEKEMYDSIETSYNFHPDLGHIAELLQAGKIDEVLKIEPQPMIPSKVMLAERLPDLNEILDKMEGKAAFEYKYDGLRTQIHADRGQVRIFSRGTEETTRQFPDIVKAFEKTFQCKSCILDGEAVPYNPETGELYPFQTVSQRRGRKYDLERVSQEIPIVVFLFDIIYLNGESLASLPYPERRKILEGLFEENESFKLAKSIVSEDRDEIKKFFNESIASGCEGIVAKNVNEESIYRAGARGWLWIKFKRDYQAQLGDTLDLVVVGAFDGHGRRKGTYGALLMAVYNKKTDTFETLCKLGTGFTDDVLFNLPRRFSELTREKIPPRVESSIVADHWIYPEVVMEIVGAEITLSPIHTCGFEKIEKGSGLALRFPRFSGRWREDKKPEDATSTQEVLEMYSEQIKSMQK